MVYYFCRLYQVYDVFYYLIFSNKHIDVCLYIFLQHNHFTWMLAK